MNWLEDPPTHWYKLDADRKVVKATSWDDVHMEFKDKIVKQEYVGGYWISTVFLGLDHYFGGDPDHAPLVFETMVFPATGSRSEKDMERYCTWEEAERGHRAYVTIYGSASMRKWYWWLPDWVFEAMTWIHHRWHRYVVWPRLVRSIERWRAEQEKKEAKDEAHSGNGN